MYPSLSYATVRYEWKMERDQRNSEISCGKKTMSNDYETRPYIPFTGFLLLPPSYVQLTISSAHDVRHLESV